MWVLRLVCQLPVVERIATGRGAKRCRAPLEPGLEAIEEISRRLDLVEYYVFSPDTRKPGSDAGARPTFASEPQLHLGLS